MNCAATSFAKTRSTLTGWRSLIKAPYLSNSKGISAIEQASWDILGKSLNAPLWQIFGGKHHETLRVYANGWYRGRATPPTLPKAAQMVAKGYTALVRPLRRSSTSRSPRRAKTWQSRSFEPYARPWGAAWTS